MGLQNLEFWVSGWRILDFGLRFLGRRCSDIVIICLFLHLGVSFWGIRFYIVGFWVSNLGIRLVFSYFLSFRISFSMSEVGVLDFDLNFMGRNLIIITLLVSPRSSGCKFCEFLDLRFLGLIFPGFRFILDFQVSGSPDLHSFIGFKSLHFRLAWCWL